MLAIIVMPAQAGEYSAGLANYDISPSPNVDVLYTIMGQQKSFSRVEGPLFVQILALSEGHERVAFVSLDLLFLHKQHHQALQKLLLKQHDHVLITVTHTHSGYYNAKKWPSLKNKGAVP
jgi:hypothetical protein